MKPVTLFLFASALHVSGLWLAGNAALADELPADTTAIEALTVDQAGSLAAGFAGVNAQVAIKGGRPVVRRNCLPLNGLPALEAGTAEALAGYRRGPLVLNGLAMLDADAARALGEFKGQELYLNGLTTLDPAAATITALAGSGAWACRLPHLSALDPAAARTLVAIEKWETSSSRSGWTNGGTDSGRASPSDPASRGQIPAVRGR